MGSPDFALPTLSALAGDYQVVGVVTQPARAAGRGRELKAPPIKTSALELNIPVIQPERINKPEALSQLQAWNADLIVVAAFGQILKKEILEMPHYGCVNVHASLLPRWRGAAPINAAILHGDEETGVTIMQMDAGLDTGAMLTKKILRDISTHTAGSAAQALSTLGADLLIETLPDYLAGKLTPIAQREEDMTYAPMLKKEDGRLDFSHSAVDLERRVRAMNPWPGAWLLWNENPLKVLRASVGDANPSSKIGSRMIVGGNPAIQSAGGILILEEVQPAGKKPMSGKSFLLGAKNWA